MTSEDMVILGRQAGDLLTNAAFLQAVTDLRENLASRFFASKPEDTAGRERVYQMRLTLDAVIGNLQSYAYQRQQIETLEQSEDE